MFSINIPYVQAVTSTNRLEVRNELKEERVSSRTAQMVEFKNSKAVMNRVVVTSKETNSIHVTDHDGSSVTILIDANTVLRRRYWGKSSLDEFQIGDSVTIYGKWADDEKSTVNARFIRNWSIQKRNGVFFGNVLSVTEKGWVIETKRGNQTVTSGGIITNRRGDVIGKADVLISHRVRVKGLWDRTGNTITEVTGVKDYSLPIRVTATPGI